MLLPLTGRMAEWPQHQVGTGESGPLESWVHLHEHGDTLFRCEIGQCERPWL